MADVRVKCKKCGHPFVIDEDRLDEFRCQTPGCPSTECEVIPENRPADVKPSDKRRGARPQNQNTAGHDPGPYEPDPLSVRLKDGVNTRWWVFPLILVSAIVATVA